MKNKGLFIVEAPFQLVSAYEAIKAYKLTDYQIHIRLSQNNNMQLKNVAKILFEKDEKKISYFYIENKNRQWKDYLTAIRYYLYSFFYRFFYHYIFIGNYESRFLYPIVKMVGKNKIVLLDDGIKGFLIYNNFSDNFSYNMFTMLNTLKPFHNQIILYNQFNRLKSFHKKNLLSKYQNDNIIFLGSKLSEASIISSDYYIKMMGKVLSIYQNFNIIYIPHRGENIQKLDNLQKDFNNFTIKEIDFPVELYILMENSIPKEVLSFYSAALLSVKSIYPEIIVKAILFDYSLSKFKNSIDLAYQNLKNYNIEIIDIKSKNMRKYL